ncbi:MAG: glycosyltransferase [Anaerolineae bacterium]|nr:glycosyltransferase [Anaerolineae bacterium]
MNVVIFTSSYPYDYASEQTFLQGEVKLLCQSFDRLILVPRTVKGNQLPILGAVEVDESFANSFTLSKRIVASLGAIFTRDFYLDIKEHFPLSLKPSYIRRLFSFLAGARLSRNWVNAWLKKNRVEDTVFYTYWFDELTMGIGLAKENHPSLRVVSRAHGFDIYEELYKIWPCRRRAIEMIDGLFSASRAGKDYFLKKYPQYEKKYHISLLGVADPGGICQPSQDGVLRIVSCSMIIDLKRVDLLLEGIARAAQKRNGQKFEWHHFGEGEGRASLVERIKKEFPPNAKGTLYGFVPHRDVIRFYLEQPVDIFSNVSFTEGTPVSIMEAISCGIPVIATAVGGNVEIVQERNGFLLGKDPTPDEIADVLLFVCDNREVWNDKRRGSREIWQERYNEVTNFKTFAQALVKIRER